MNKYLNGGIIKSFTLFFKNEKDLADILGFLQDKIDLNLFHMEIKDNCLLFEINKDLLKKYFLDFLLEIKAKELYKFNTIDYIIKYFNKCKNKDIYKIIKDCDDIFIDNLKYTDYSTLSNDTYKIDIEYIVFYYEGPIKLEYYDHFINLILKLFKNSLDNPLNQALCFGISE